MRSVGGAGDPLEWWSRDIVRMYENESGNAWQYFKYAAHVRASQCEGDRM